MIELPQSERIKPRKVQTCKTLLNWFIPAFTNNREGSLRGRTGLDGINLCPWAWKNSRNCDLTSELVCFNLFKKKNVVFMLLSNTNSS